MKINLAKVEDMRYSVSILFVLVLHNSTACDNIIAIFSFCLVIP